MKILWRFGTTLGALVSFVLVLFLWSRLFKKSDDDPYYMFGDSQYRGDLGEEPIRYSDQASPSPYSGTQPPPHGYPGEAAQKEDDNGDGMMLH